jgi:hypothetical protein
MRLISDLGVRDTLLSFSNLHTWSPSDLGPLKKEAARLVDFFQSIYQRTKAIPLRNFRPTTSKGLFFCTGGRTRLALAPDGRIWGCHMLPDCMEHLPNDPVGQGYCFGTLDDVRSDPDAVFQNVLPCYDRLRLELCYTDRGVCALCRDLEECAVCPVTAAFSSGTIGHIPSWMCEVRKIMRDARRSFLEKIEAT